MPRKPSPVPAYLRHTQSGRARVAWTDPASQTRRSLLLPGLYGSDESQAAYRRFLTSHAATPPTPAVPTSTLGPASEVKVARVS